MGKSLHSPKVVVRERSGGLCEKCERVLTKNINGVPGEDTARSIHHRQPKRAGGRDSVVNMVNLCIKCHREIHEDEEKAASEGWIVLGLSPAHAPFKGWRGWVLPQPDGALSLVDWESGRVRELTPAPQTRLPTRRRHRLVKSLPRIA